MSNAHMVFENFEFSAGKLQALLTYENSQMHEEIQFHPMPDLIKAFSPVKS